MPWALDGITDIVWLLNLLIGNYLEKNIGCKNAVSVLVTAFGATFFLFYRIWICARRQNISNTMT
jgi:hypothetical protein